MAEKEFRVNEYIVLKLEKGITEIYFNGLKFGHCKHLLFNIKRNKMKDLLHIKSMDEFSGSYENIDNITIDSNTEFWAHCSNLQAWYENNYNTDILVMDIAFPLLEALYKSGDKKAVEVYKEELLRRFNSKYEPVRDFLFENYFLEFFTDEELESMGLLEWILSKIDKIKMFKFLTMLLNDDVEKYYDVYIEEILKTITGNEKELKYYLIDSGCLKNLPKKIIKENIKRIEELRYRAPPKIKKKIKSFLLHFEF